MERKSTTEGKAAQILWNLRFLPRSITPAPVGYAVRRTGPPIEI